MPAQAIAELDAAAGPNGVASTDALRGVHIELDRRKPGEHRLAVAQRYQHPDRRLVERFCADLGWPRTAQERSLRYAGVMRITVVTFRPVMEPPAQHLRPEQPTLAALPAIPGTGSPTPVAPVLDKTDTDARFAAFHAANPHVYAALRAVALQLVAQGETRIGVKRLYEQLRGDARTAGNEPYRLNNIFTSRYARLLNREPELTGKIELRKLRS